MVFSYLKYHVIYYFVICYILMLLPNELTCLLNLIVIQTKEVTLLFMWASPQALAEC